MNDGLYVHNQMAKLGTMNQEPGTISNKEPVTSNPSAHRRGLSASCRVPKAVLSAASSSV